MLGAMLGTTTELTATDKVTIWVMVRLILASEFLEKVFSLLFRQAQESKVSSRDLINQTMT